MSILLHTTLVSAFVAVLTSAVSDTELFPAYPTGFKTRITGYINGNSDVSFSIEQYYFTSGGNETGKAILNMDTRLRGYIHDDIKNHSVCFNFTDCQMEPLGENNAYYEPFSFFTESEVGGNAAFGAFVDAFKLFQNRSMISETRIILTDNITYIHYTYSGTDGTRYPYTINVLVNSELKQIDSVQISKKVDNVTVPLVMMRYDSIITMEDNSLVTMPPNDMFCISDHVVPMPSLGLFYSMEIRTLSEFYKHQEYLGLIKLSEYTYENMISIGYHATTTNSVHQANIVHNYGTGIGSIVNKDAGMCTKYSLTSSTLNQTLREKKIQFREEVLRHMHFPDKQYFVQFWNVLEALKGTTSWQYQGVRMVDSVQCNVWSYPLSGKSWIAQVAFSVTKVKLRESSYTSKLRSVLVSVDLFRTETSPDEQPAISFRISDYQIDSNPVATELMYDTSICYSDQDDTCVVQFKLDVEYTKVHQYGLGRVIRAVTKSLIAATGLEQHQVHHLSLIAVPDNQCLVTFTVYQSIENNIMSIHLFKDTLKDAINNRMSVTFTNDNTSFIQVSYTVKDSAVFDYQSVTSHHWTVSVAATISMCIGTAFIGAFIGVILVNCWYRKKDTLKAGGNSPNYRRFKDDEIEEVEMGIQI